MDEAPELIRQQMNETRAQLGDKLQSLEQQVSDSVQSTGEAVSATAEAVQDAVQSVSDAFDIQLQINRHPWLVLGGAAFAGYVLEDLFAGANQKKIKSRRNGTLPNSCLATAGRAGSTPESESLSKCENAAGPIGDVLPGARGRDGRLRNGLVDLALEMAKTVAVAAIPQLLGLMNRSCSPVNADSLTESVRDVPNGSRLDL